jgi:hypothetical protein
VLSRSWPTIGGTSVGSTHPQLSAAKAPASGILSVQSELETEYEVGTTIAEIR